MRSHHQSLIPHAMRLQSVASASASPGKPRKGDGRRTRRPRRRLPACRRSAWFGASASICAHEQWRRGDRRGAARPLQRSIPFTDGSPPRGSQVTFSEEQLHARLDHVGQTRRLEPIRASIEYLAPASGRGRRGDPIASPPHPPSESPISTGSVRTSSSRSSPRQGRPRSSCFSLTSGGQVYAASATDFRRRARLTDIESYLAQRRSRDRGFESPDERRPAPRRCRGDLDPLGRPAELDGKPGRS